MLTTGTGVRRALGNNIHIVSSVLMHMVLGVFFVTHTQRPVLQDNNQLGSVVAEAPLSEDTVEKASSVDIASESLKKSSQHAVDHLKKDAQQLPMPSILPPGNVGKSARMSLAMSSDRHQDQELEEMLQSEKGVSFSGIGYNNSNSGLYQNEFEVSNSSEKYVPDNVIGSVMEQFAECWTIPSDIRNENTVVRINLALDQNGKVTTAAVADTYLYDHNQTFRALADSALRAVYKCSPLSDLKEADYSLWNEIVLTFDPQNTY